jgi:glutamate 5-kinase
MVTDAGDAMVVADGRMPNVLIRLLDHEVLGTLFSPSPKKRTSRSRWIGSARPVGTITIDAGAVRALVEKNRSLLPAGIVAVQGPFDKGDLISIQADGGAEMARGLSNYPSQVISQIQGKKTADVRTLLGEAAYDEVVHRDNLVILNSGDTAQKASLRNLS